MLGGRAHSTFRRWQCWLESEAATWDAVLLMRAGKICSAHGEAKGAGSHEATVILRKAIMRRGRVQKSIRGALMTSPIEIITVLCPICKKEFLDWYRPSINLSLGVEWTEEALEMASSVDCPTCGLRQQVSNLVVKKDGVWDIPE